MRITILHQAASEESAVDEQDVLRQRDAVCDSLQRLGHDVEVMPCSLALDRLRESLVQQHPDVVFNLVESLAGSDRLMSLVPLLLESLQIPYTGTPVEAIQLTGSKTRAKERLARAGLPTLPWVGRGGDNTLHNAGAQAATWPSRWIRKPIYEHASFGMTDEAVVECGCLDEVIRETLAWQQRLSRPCLAEPFIDGREINVSLLATEDGLQVLPAAEIEFVGFATDKPRIVGFAAKWDAAGQEYANTPRSFHFPETDLPLLSQLADLSRRCWAEFALEGYCRVDFRIDQQGCPWILEINANPCLSPDAGFAAAVEAAGVTYDQAIASIVRDASER